MIHVIPVRTVGTNVLVMVVASEATANAIHASLEHTVILYAQDTARAVMRHASVRVNGRVITAKSPSVQMIALEMEYATVPFSPVSVTRGGVATIAANLTVQENRIVIIEAHVPR